MDERRWTTQALRETFGAAGCSVRLVVLSACYSDLQAEALRAHVDCVVGMSGAIIDDAARNFAIGFYGGLGERESIAAAFRQGCAAISLEGLRDNDRPQLRARWAASNEAVVRGFWEAVGPKYQPPLSNETIATAIARAEGNVLHAVMLHDALRDRPASERHADRVPRGLTGEIWDRAASHAAVRVGLGLLCVAREALSLDVLAETTGWSYDEKERFAREARQLLLEEPAAWAGVDAYRPRHDWVRELIAERLGAATVRQHHATLARTLAAWPARLGGARGAIRSAPPAPPSGRGGRPGWRVGTSRS